MLIYRKLNCIVGCVMISVLSIELDSIGISQPFTFLAETNGLVKQKKKKKKGKS